MMVWGLLSVGWFLHRPTDQRQRQLVVGGEPQHLSTRGWRSERGTHQKEVRLGWAVGGSEEKKSAPKTNSRNIL